MTGHWPFSVRSSVAVGKIRHYQRRLCQTSPMETASPPRLLQHLWKSTLASGVIAVLLGILAWRWPAITLFVAALFFGAYLLLNGISQVILAFSLHVSFSGRLLLFVSGAASLILSVLCFISLQDSIMLLAIWIGVGFIFRGVVTAVSAISDPTLPGRVWEVVIGVISLLAGIMLLLRPFESIHALAVVVGIWLIGIGVFEVLSAFAIRYGAKEAASRG